MSDNYVLKCPYCQLPAYQNHTAWWAKYHCGTEQHNNISDGETVRELFQSRECKLRCLTAELLEALERCVPWLGKMIADGAHMNATLPNDAVRSLEMAEAAISKAKGNS